MIPLKSVTKLSLTMPDPLAHYEDIEKYRTKDFKLTRIQGVIHPHYVSCYALTNYIAAGMDHSIP